MYHRYTRERAQTPTQKERDSSDATTTGLHRVHLPVHHNIYNTANNTANKTKTNLHFANTRRKNRKRIPLTQCSGCCLRATGILTTSLLVGVYLCFMFGALVPVNKHVPHPPLGPYPYPPPNITVTAIIMNYARPRMLQTSSLLPTLLSHPAVSQILLCHAHPQTAFVREHAKILNIDATAANDEWGLALRFYYCDSALQTNDWVVFLDDDMELDDSALNALIAHMVDDPHRLVGHYARRYQYWKVPHRHGYDFATTVSGPVEVVLTKVLILERAVCHQFGLRAPLVRDLVATSVPRWNGEDIFLNLVANHYYHVPRNGPYRNCAVPDLNVWEADNDYKDDDAGRHDISANMDRHTLWEAGWRDYGSAWWRSLQHYRYRGKLWSTAKARLYALPPPPSMITHGP